jgi:hypothetical protein
MNTKVISQRVVEILRRSENALATRADEYIKANEEQRKSNLDQIAAASSGSWRGYHANVYYQGLQTPRPGDHFSSEWGLMAVFSRHTSQNWVECPKDAIRKAADTDIDGDFLARLEALSDSAAKVCQEGQDTLLTVVDVLLDAKKTSTLERLRDDIKKIEHRTSAHKFVEVMRPTGSFMSRDSTAISQGIRVPPHAAMRAELISLFSPFTGIEKLIKACRNVLDYMEVHDMVDAKTIKKAERVFIGHGRSPDWRELKDFLQERLGLTWEEFNREPTAGQSTADRIQAMLDNSCFAFIVMTAEDEHADKALHARENVIHEAGLFQGRLGFKKAIILLEEGCAEFSNITGLGQVRFPKRNISTAFEEIRRVLEREKIL